MTRSLQDQPDASAGGRLRNTAELSGELSVGDIVAVGDVLLAVARAGWERVTGPLAEASTHEHGTRPLPEPPRPASPYPTLPLPAAKENRDECP